MQSLRSAALSIDKWHEYALQGAFLPMRIPIHGVSMLPLIRMDHDMVTVEPYRDKPLVGDIVLFSDPTIKQRYVLHRLWAINGERVITWGDNCDIPDHEMPIDCIWGKATLIERGRHRIKPDPSRGLKLAKVWHHVGKWCRHGKMRIYKLLRPLWHIVKPLFHRKAK